MKKVYSLYSSFLIVCISIISLAATTGCANMIPPEGGPRDTLPPLLISATPTDSATRFTGDRITLNFDEFVEVENALENVIVSPTPNNTPIINHRLRTVSIRLKDTLEPSTTYSINFGNSLKDINEGNVFPDFTYVFSTGNSIDSNTFSGRVVMAQTGDVDSTLIVVLHRSLDDSAVAKERPRYITKVDGKGNFQFRFLPSETFAVYALPNEYSKRYDDTTKPFAFADKPIFTANAQPITLYAYQLPRIDTVAKPKPEADRGGNKKEDKQLRLLTNLDGGRQDLLKNLVIDFNKPITGYDSTKIRFTDNENRPITNYTFARDTNNTRFILRHTWPVNTLYQLIIDKTAFADSAGLTLLRNDTIRFYTKTAEDYGSVRLRFRNIDFTKNPVLQIVQGENLIESSPLTQAEWYRKLYNPGDYDLRILYDTNKNGVWDPGRFFGEHRQPEIAITLNTKLNVRANWDNEKDISF